VLGFGSAAAGLVDAHVPTSEGVDWVPAPGPVPPLGPVPFGVLGVLTDVGTRTLVVCWYPQAVAISEAAARVRSRRGLFII
jgi:hypothetical protein